MTVRTNNEMIPSYTVISNEFIDSYMASANGEYVKVYLYVLRAGGDASCEQIADALEMTASDAARAVNYWSKRGLLSMHEDEDAQATPQRAAQQPAVHRGRPEMGTPLMPEGGDAVNPAAVDRSMADGNAAVSPMNVGKSMYTGAADVVRNAGMTDLGQTTAAQTAATRTAATQAAAIHPESGAAAAANVSKASKDTPQAREAIDLEKLQEDEEFAALLYCLQKYMGRTFGQKDVESLGYIYDGLHMSADMIEYLAEVCVKRGRTKSSYMEAIARDWADKGITTVEAAKAETSQYGSQVWTVMRAFGLNDRKPAQVEIEYVEKWFGTYGMPEEMVKEAISRTMEAIHKPSFAYADSILEKWHTAGAHRMEEIEALDKEHEKRSRSQAQGAGGYAKPRTTGFSNFEQRDVDLDSGMLAMLKDKL